MREGAAVSARICVPVSQLVQVDSMVSVAAAAWTCRLCGADGGLANTAAQASGHATEHLIAEHGATVHLVEGTGHGG